MTQRFDCLLKGGIAVTPSGIAEADIGLKNGRITAIGLGDAFAADKAEHVLDVTGLHVLPGVIDSQVHFREPGAEHKETLATGSRAAVKGGVTAVFEMPNTKPATTDAAALADKLERAKTMFCDHAFYLGANGHNSPDLAELERHPGCCGVKIFMGSSTGSLLVSEDDALEAALRGLQRRCAVHAEDEPRLIERKGEALEGRPETHPVWRDEETAIRATKRLLALAAKTGRSVHVLHVTTAEEMALLADHKSFATVEVTPQHLTLAAEDAYERLGTHAQMNPPIRGKRHRTALWAAVESGVVDVLGSDHAPHTLEEKAKTYPATPAGLPGVQTLVPLMLDHVNAGRLSLTRFVDLVCHGPQRLFGIAGKGRLAVGYDGDLTVVDLKAVRTIEESWLESKAGWSPFTGMTLKGWPVGTVIRGHVVMWDDEILGAPRGEPIRFWGTRTPAAA